VADDRVVEERLAPRWPVRLPRGRSQDRVMRCIKGVVERLVHVGPSPVRVRAWHARDGYVHLRAESIHPSLVEHRVVPEGADPDPPPAGVPELEIALERMRFVFALQDDMGEFFRTYRWDPLLGPGIRRKPWARPRRRPWPWEALAWAITSQLIEAMRAAEIQRRIVNRWSPRASVGQWPLKDVPSAAVIAGRSPAELVSMDLTEARALALLRCAKEVESGRADLSDPDSNERLLSIREIGPWTVQCVGFHGRGEPDCLPAGDLAYVKLVGYLTGLGRQATVDEVEEYFAPYAPFRGLAGTFALAGWHKAIPAGLKPAPEQLAA
jgi:3-methyladenine DNA glycosylase/8-oxoguanine DNA glycosylase